jgi:hypothetical protein
MASLEALKMCVSENMGVPLATVNSWALILRKEGLITSGGKGRTVEMTASDATNLMLPGLIDGLSTEAARNVRRLRAMPLDDYRNSHLDGDSWQLDRYNHGAAFYEGLPHFMRLATSRTASFGKALDMLLEGRTGCDVHDIKVSEFNSRVEAEIYVREDPKGWVLRFAQGTTRKGRTIAISLGGDEFSAIAQTVGGVL